MIDDSQLDAVRRAQAARIDTAAPNPARVADFLNGGRSNFEADRRVARVMLAAAPAIAAIVPAVLAFQQRAVRFLALEAGIRQFLDIGTGLPGAEISRDTAQSVDPACRVVYVDNDPMVLSYVRAYARSTAQGAIAALDAKATDPEALLAGAAATLDLGQPVAVLLPATLMFVSSARRAAGIVSALLAALSRGSCLALCHVASDLDPALEAGALEWNRMAPGQITPRSRAEVAGLVAGLDLVDPGLVPVDQWRPADQGSPADQGRPAPGGGRRDEEAPVYAVLARARDRPEPLR
ncbi:MAG TPA: SAM-dependent methyltransferase [Trebonia sp.]